MFSDKSKPNGFSIIEVLVALGILSVLTMAMMQLSETSFQAARAVRQSTTAVSVKQGINTLLNSVSMCAGSFTDLDNANPINLGVNWAAPKAIRRISFGTETLAEVGQVHGELNTDRITLTKQEGPFDVQVNITPGGPAPTMQMMKRYTATLNLSQRKASAEATPGGTAMQSSTFYLVLTADNTGRLHNCYGGAQWDMLRDICEHQLDGEWDASQSPSCLIRRLTLANSFASRQIASDATFPRLALQAGTPNPPGLTVEGVLSPRGGLFFGDFGGWQGVTHDRSWINRCPQDPALPCNLVSGDIARGMLHISGMVNPRFPIGFSGEANSRRLVSLFDHLAVPDPYARVWIGTDSIPSGNINNAGVFHVVNNYGAGAPAIVAPEATNHTAVFESTGLTAMAVVAGPQPTTVQGTVSQLALTDRPVGTRPYWYMALAKDFGSATDQGFHLGRQPIGALHTNYMIISQGGTVNFPEGKVRIGGAYNTDALPGLSITGDLRATGIARATQFTTLSDLRLKTNVRSAGESLAKLRRLSAKIFQWKDDASKKNQMGLIAQEVEAEFPELILSDEKGFKSIDYAGLSAVLLEGVKELDLKIEDLDARLKRLER